MTKSDVGSILRRITARNTVGIRALYGYPWIWISIAGFWSEYGRVIRSEYSFKFQMGRGIFDCTAKLRIKFTRNPRNTTSKYTRARNPKETCTRITQIRRDKRPKISHSLMRGGERTCYFT
jgi:hypothetical protein